MSPLPFIPLRSGPYAGMQHHFAGPSEPPDLAYWMQNLYSVDPVRGGPLMPRTTIAQVVTLTGTVLWIGNAVLDQSTYPFFAVTTDGFWRCNYDDSPSEVTAELVVDAADLATLNIVLNVGIELYAVNYNGKLIFSGYVGVEERPLSWNGMSGIAGLAVLTNAPRFFGQPVVYAGKLWGLKWAQTNPDRTEIVWSEENAENLGYEAGGYSNVWAVKQTSPLDIMVLLPRNDGLWYWRDPVGIGRITGHVTSDFRTTAVDDEISLAHGTKSTRVVSVKDKAWFFDSLGRPTAVDLRSGEIFELWRDAPEIFHRSAAHMKPLSAWDDVSWIPSWDVNIGLLSGFGGNLRVVYCPLENCVLFLGRVNVGEGFWWDADTLRCQGYVTHGFGGTASRQAATTLELKSLTAGSAQGLPTWVFSNGGTTFYWHKDEGTGETPTCRLIGPLLGYDRRRDLTFDRTFLQLRQDNVSALSASFRYWTSEKPNDDTAPVAQSRSTGAGSSDHALERNLEYGLDAHGRWIRPGVEIIGQGFALHGVEIEAYRSEPVGGRTR